MGVEFCAHAETVEGFQRMRQERLTDFETRKLLLFANHDAPSFAGEQRGGSRTSRAAANDGYIVDF